MTRAADISVEGEPDRRDWVAFLEKIGIPILSHGGPS
jgi:hypothetical protein